MKKKESLLRTLGICLVCLVVFLWAVNGVLTKLVFPVASAIASVINPKPAVAPDNSLLRLQSLIGDETVKFDDGDQIRYELTSEEGRFIRIVVSDKVSDKTTFVKLYLDGTVWEGANKLHTDLAYGEAYELNPDDPWFQSQPSALKEKYDRLADSYLRTIYSHFGINSEDGKARIPASVRRQIARSEATLANKAAKNVANATINK